MGWCRGIRAWAAALVGLALAAGTGAAASPGSEIVAAPLPPEILVARGPATPLIGQPQRAQIGIKNGPDSIADFWLAPDGRGYLVFSGALQSGVRGTFRVPVDPSLSRITATGPADVSVVLTPRCPQARHQRPAGTCQDFDSNYAGGGTVFRCPNGRILYFYHGENHTDPTGLMHHGPRQGWTGIGVASWDAAARRFVDPHQVVGMNASNRWEDRGGMTATQQGPPISGNPSATPDPTGRFVYLYFLDRTEDPDYAARPLACDRRPCAAVARAETGAACAAGGAAPAGAWRLYYRGSFSQPALFTAAAAAALPAGTGGRFTPLYPRFERTGETVANVTYLSARRLYVMIALRQPGAAVIARYSSDGLRWSQPSVVVPSEHDPEMRRLYPRLNVAREPGGGERYVLTYLVKTRRHRWEFAELLQQTLGFARR